MTRAAFLALLIGLSCSSVSSSVSYGCYRTSCCEQPPASIGRPTPFPTGHSTTSALLQLRSDIETGFNQKKPQPRTVCVAVDITAAFDIVKHNILLSKSRPVDGYQATFEADNHLHAAEVLMIVHNGVPQGSKRSTTVFSFYLDNMPRLKEPVKLIY